MTVKDVNTQEPAKGSVIDDEFDLEAAKEAERVHQQEILANLERERGYVPPEETKQESALRTSLENDVSNDDFTAARIAMQSDGDQAPRIWTENIVSQTPEHSDADESVATSEINEDLGDASLPEVDLPTTYRTWNMLPTLLRFSPTIATTYRNSKNVLRPLCPTPPLQMKSPRLSLSISIPQASCLL